MKHRRIVNAIDVFAVGMIHRVVIGGAPDVRGASIAQKIDYLKNNLDYFRQVVVEGPDDDKGLVAGLITEPVTDEANVGFILLAPQGYPGMSGSLSFAVGTALIETGVVQPSEPVTRLALDSPAGLVKMRAQVHNGIVENVTTQMPPAFFYRSVTLQVPRLGGVPVDIAYGLNYFEPMVDARKLGIELDVSNVARLEEVGLTIRDEVNANVELRHPTDPAIDRVGQVQFYDPSPDRAGVDCRSFVVLGPGAFDFTPSGTSTCAHMAFLYAKGALEIDDEFVMESVVGAVIKGRIVAESNVGDYSGIIPEITGEASISRFLTITG